MVKMSIGTGVDSSAAKAKRVRSGPSKDTPPVVITAPALSGAGRIGQAMTASLGVWGGSPAPGLSARWQRNGTDIPGATGASYTPVPADDMADLRCVVTASNRAGTLATATVHVRITHAPPVVAGGLADRSFDLAGGTREIETAGGFAGAALTFSVTGAGAGIDPATGLVSIPVSAALDATPVTVTASNSGGSAAITFGVTVALAGSAPSVLSAPILSGTGRIGSPVTVAEGVWGGVPSPRLSLRWQRNGADIPDATGTSYTPVPADDKADLRCVVTASNSFGTASATTGTVKVAYAAPVAAGNLFEEIFDQDAGFQTVDAASDFTVAGDPGLSGVSWSVSGAGASIDATGMVSVPTAAPVSAEAVTVTATNSGGFAESVFLVTIEGETGAAPFDVALSPSIATPGTHVTARPVHADGSGPTGNETFQWLEDGVPIGGATWPVYVARKEHVGAKGLTCRITDPAKGTAMSAAAVVTDAVYPGSGAATNAATRLSQWNALPLSGGTIWCAAGDYAAWSPPARLFTGPVTIRSVDPANPAVFLGTNFSTKSTNVIFRDIKNRLPVTASTYNYTAHSIVRGGSEKITFLNCSHISEIGQNPSDPLYNGLLAVGRMLNFGGNCFDVAVIGCEFTTSSRAVSVENSLANRITLEGNAIRELSGDSLQFVACAGGRILKNSISDMISGSGPDSDHVDGIQFYNSGASRPNSDFLIEGNIVHSGSAAYEWFQSIFLSAESNVTNRHQDITVRNNLVYNAHQWGIVISSADRVLIENNTVLRNFAQTSTASDTKISAINCTEVTIRKNVAQDIVTTGSTGVTLDDNYVYIPVAAGSQAEFVGGLIAGSTIAQLQPVTGGAILTGGYGATYTDQAPGGGVDLAFSLDALPFNRFVYNSANNTTATVTLTGKGTTGDSIQIRGESAGGNTSWSSGVTVDEGGNWRATLSVPLAQWANWYTPAARIGTNDATKLTGANTFGCGHVIGVMGQSECQYIFSNGSYWNAQTTPSGLTEQNAVFSLDNDGAGSDGVFSPTSATFTATATASKSSVYMANLLAAGAPGRKWHIVDLCVVGTSRRQLMDDSSTGRSWADFEAAVSGAIGGSRQAGLNITEMGHLVECWYTSDPNVSDWSVDYGPFYSGQTSAGDSHPLGTANPAGNIVDHCLWDLTGAGRGLFGTNTKWSVLGPNPYVGNGVTFTSYSAPYDPGQAASGEALQAFHASSRFDTIRGHYGPDPIYMIGRFDGSIWQDSIHPSISNLEGTPYHAMHFAVAMLNAAGVSYPSPKITGVTAEATGAYVDVIVNLPNNGTLTTGRIRQGLPAPSPAPAHRQPVTGFEIRRAGQPWTSATVLNFTATIVDTGTGSAPSRTGKVRITPTVPFANGDIIGYLRGGADGMLIYQNENAAKMLLDMLVENVPALTTTNAPYDGIPVDTHTTDTLVVALGGGGRGGDPGPFVPSWYGATGQLINSAPGSSFTAVADVGIKKQTLICTWKPGLTATSRTQIWFYCNTLQLYCDGRYLRVQNPVNFQTPLVFDMQTISDWTTHRYAGIINLDTTRATVEDRAQGRLIDLTTGTTHPMLPASTLAFPTQDADIPAFANGKPQAYGAQNPSVFTGQFDGEMERVQSWVNVCANLADLSGLYDGALKDPGDAGLIAAAGGGTLSAGQLVLDIHGANLPTGTNPGAGPDYTKSGSGGWVAR